MYAADRGVIYTLGQALDIAEQFPHIGVVVDAFHVWWDPIGGTLPGRTAAWYG